MIVIGLDPGTSQSALVGYDSDCALILGHCIAPNDEILLMVRSPYDLFGRWGKNSASGQTPILVIEMVESFGMAVGKEVFETVFHTGRFAQAWGQRFERVPRRIVKQHLCHTARATDSNIRQALIDRFGPSTEKAIGTKKAPGPLYGITSHKIAALAVALTWADQHPHEPTGELIRPGVVADF